MSRKTLFYILGGVVIGIFYSWFNSYNDPMVYGLRVRTLLMTACSIVTFLLCYFEKGKPIQTAFLISVGVGIAIILRISWDTIMIDRTMHNLAPFEILIGAGLAFATSLLGGYAGRLVRPRNKT